jgi:hypothetical protein
MAAALHAMAAAARPAEMDPDHLPESRARLRGHVDALELRLRKSDDGRRAVLHLIGDRNDQQALAQVRYARPRAGVGGPSRLGGYTRLNNGHRQSRTRPAPSQKALGEPGRAARSRQWRRY